jgi:hypothetical protein
MRCQRERDEQTLRIAAPLLVFVALMLVILFGLWLFSSMFDFLHDHGAATFLGAVVLALVLTNVTLARRI